MTQHLKIVFFLVALSSCTDDLRDINFLVENETDSDSYLNDEGGSTDREVDSSFSGGQDGTEQQQTGSDACLDDPNKTKPGVCGCGIRDVDSDGDGTPDCHDKCPDDPNKTDPGQCGCEVDEGDCRTIVMLSYGGISGEEKSQRYFDFVVPFGASQVEIKLYGGAGDADLFVKLGGGVGANSFDCRPQIWGAGVTERCEFNKPGEFSIMVYAYGSIANWSLTGSYY